VKHGDQCGCHDQGPPETYADEQLSRVHDILKLADEIGDRTKISIWTALPTKLKLEFNYSNWRYHERGKDDSF
jgi:hypothetical protein